MGISTLESLGKGLSDVDLAGLSFHNSGKPVFGRETLYRPDDIC